MSVHEVPTTADLPPRDVQLSTLLWVGAISFGGIETVLGATDALSSGSMSGLAVLVSVVLRAAVYTALLAIVAQLWRGRGWARVALALLLGGIGMATLLAGPVGWLADGHTVTELSLTEPQQVALATIRSMHIMSVVAATVLIFRPAANAWFRATARRGP